MPDFATIVIVLLLTLFCITLLGHGIWVFLAWLFRSAGGADQHRAGRSHRDVCPFCGQHTPPSLERCDWCGRLLEGELADRVRQLQAAIGSLRDLETQQVLTSAEATALIDRVIAHRAKLIARPGFVAMKATPEPAKSAPPVVPAEHPSRPADLAPIAAELVEPSAPAKVLAPTPAAPIVLAIAPLVNLNTETSTDGCHAHACVSMPMASVDKATAASPAVRAAKIPAVDKPPPRVAPVRPATPRKSWGEIITQFMEPHNIRWGEVIGGLLFIVGAAALVVTQWETLQHFRYFRFVISLAVSAGVFGLGLYSHYRWKLQATSRGLLTIATLLVPLNFLATAGLAKDDPLLLTLAFEATAMALFGGLLLLSGRILVPGGRWFQMATLLGISAAVLLFARRFDPQSAPPLLILAGCLPVAIYAGGVAGYSYRTVRRRPTGAIPPRVLSPVRAVGIFQFAGTAAFALCVALGVLVFRMAGPGLVTAAMEYLSVPIVLAAATSLVLGLTVRSQMRPKPAAEPYRMAGMWIALVSGLLMLVALGMAWPRPELVLAVAITAAATLAAAALEFDLPVFHAGAIACGAAAYLSGYFLWSGDLAGLSREQLGPAMLRLATTAPCAASLAGLFGLLVLASELLARWRRAADSHVYAFGAAAVAVLSLAVVSVAQPVDALRAAVVYGLYGAAGLAINLRVRRPLITYLSLALLAATTVWGLWRATVEIGPLWAGVFAIESSLLGILAAVVLRDGTGRSLKIPNADWVWTPAGLRDTYGLPLAHSAAMGSFISLAFAIIVAANQLSAAAVPHEPWLIITAACLTALYLVLAWLDRAAQWAWGASMVLALGLLHALAINFGDRVVQPWSIALLAHATLAGAAAWGLRIAVGRGRLDALAEDVRRLYIDPLGRSTMLSSAAAVVMMFVFPWQSNHTVACCLLWLSMIWLAVAWVHRWPRVFAAHQVALTAALGVWIFALYGGHLALDRPINLLHAGGIGLGVLSLAWVLVRIVLRRDPVLHGLLNPGWPAVDQLVKHATVALQLVVLLPALWAGVEREIIGSIPFSTTFPWSGASQFGLGAWGVLGVLAITLVGSLWQQWRSMELADSLLLATTLPCLIAGRFAADVALASALRWTLALEFVACSAAVWQRRRLARALRAIGARVRLHGLGASTTRTMILALAVLPVLAITLAAANQQLFWGRLAGPASGLFSRLNPTFCYLVPLVLLTIGLVGHAVRERSAGYIFSAGLVAEMAVALGYPLVLSTQGRLATDFELCTWIQLTTVATALWALGWLAARKLWGMWAEEPGRPLPRTLMSVQLALGFLGNGICLGGALLLLVFDPGSLHVSAGSWLGWVALALSAFAGIACTLQAGRRLSPNAVGLLGMSVLGLLACTIQNYWPEWGYRTLMLAWASYALLIVVASWWVASLRTLPDAQGPPQALLRAAAVWVRVAGLAALLLALKVAPWHEEQLWAAGAIALASLAGATMAVWRRREGWAFAAALGVNLAASLVVWHFHYFRSLAQWWITLLQANAIASAAVALVWLAARRRLYQLRELSITSGPLLGLQTGVGVLANAALVAMYTLWMVGPQDLAEDFSPFARAPGWIALLLAAAAAAWYLFQVAPGRMFHAVGGFVLALAALGSCAAMPLTGSYPFLHVRIFADGLALAALLVLAVGWLGRNWKTGDRRPVDASEPGQPFFAPAAVEGWTVFLSAMAVVFALLWCGRDPLGPWPLAAGVLGVGITLGLLACWRDRAEYVYASGLSVCVAGSAVWLVEHAEVSLALLTLNAGCLALGAAIWTLVPLWRPGSVPLGNWAQRPWSFPHVALAGAVAALVGAVTMAMAIVFGTVDSAGVGTAFQLGSPADWIAAGVVAVALVISFWDASARFPLLGLYATAAAAWGMSLVVRRPALDIFYWSAGVELAVFTLAAAGLGYLLSRLRGVCRLLRIPDDSNRWMTGWFPGVQAVLALVAAGLATWVTLDFRFDAIAHPLVPAIAGRIAGGLAVACLLPAALLTVRLSTGEKRFAGQCAAIGLAVLTLSTSGWAWLDAALPLPWLHRAVILMVAAAMVTVGMGLALVRLPGAIGDWSAAARRMMPALGGLAVGMLALVFAQEVYFYQPQAGTPLAHPAVAVVALALAALFVACIVFAITRQRDPLGLSPTQRQAYVYAAEALMVVFGLHLRLTLPFLFHLHLMQRYGMFLVMGVAFLWVGLSEAFRRRNLEVLAEPLETTARWLPLLPMLMFFHFATRTPLVWFLIGLFYSVLAVTRRSFWLGLAAVITGNMGLWVFWYRLDLGFFAHPQLWIIPLAMAALVAEYFSRERLTAQQRTAVRYLSLSLIYISSSADMFIAGIGNSMLLPLLLLALSVAGILIGMASRMRSFVYLGAAFMLLDVATLVKYVSIDLHQTWVFWLCVVFLGAAIIALFAALEKRRNDIRAAMERFRQWQT
jgi:hypothetical protein